ncbi:MAG: DUF4097 domain-containing protein [Acidimicrobiia bacterium]|nr:DUF4097 domain-containing protein [Acidimicrobiia bacterium]
MKRLLTLIAISALVAAACGGSTADSSFEISDEYAVLRLTGTAGSVSVQGEDQATTTIEATSNYEDTEPEVIASVFGGDLIITDTCEETSCFTDYTITVPEGTSVFVETTTGQVAIGGTTSEVTVVTTDGNITINGMSGALEVTSGSGSLLALGLSGPFAFVTTTSGVIDLSFEESIEDVRAKSTSGSITVQAPGEPYAVSAVSGSGAVDVNIETADDAPGSVTAETESGDITIYRR